MPHADLPLADEGELVLLFASFEEMLGWWKAFSRVQTLARRYNLAGTSPVESAKVDMVLKQIGKTKRYIDRQGNTETTNMFKCVPGLSI